MFECLKSCNGNKAPGPDGFNMNFLQTFWVLLKVDIIEIFNEMHHSGKFVKSLNSTFISLIPKRSGANDFRDFRSISLVGFMYKLITKMLARKLSKVLGEVIGDCQNIFVGDRQIFDVVMAANETVDNLMTTNQDGLVCKLDMKKTYDHINWKFVDYTLFRMGFGLKLRNWMKSYITTTSFAVLLNGSPSKFFNASRRSRQGNPLSLLLFIMEMEGLNRLLGRAKDLNSLRGVVVGSRDNTTEVSHLFFADDTFIFCQPDLRNLLDLRCILYWFQFVSELKINLNKSELARIGGNREAGTYASILGCKKVKFQFKYLEIPLGAKYKDKIT